MGTELDLDDVCAGHPLAQRELANLRAQLAGYKEQAASFHEEYRRKCDVETKELRAQLLQTEEQRVLEAAGFIAEQTKLRAQLAAANESLHAMIDAAIKEVKS